MSAVAAWEFPQTPKAPRRHLHSVPTGSDVLPARTVRQARWHITRRGRLTITLSVMIGLLLGGVAVARAVAAPVAGASTPTVTVEAGESLSQVAHEALPKLPVREAVARIQVENDLNSAQVQAGQVLRVPR